HPAMLLLGKLVENRDRQAVKLAVGALRDDLVDDLRARVVPNPAGDHLAELFAVLGLRRGEDLSFHDHLSSAPFGLGIPNPPEGIFQGGIFQRKVTEYSGTCVVTYPEGVPCAKTFRGEKRLDGARLGVSNPPFPKGAHAWRHCSAVR